MAKIALLIGISDYGKGLSSLPGTQEDIQAMQRVLQSSQIGSFDKVTMLLNPDRMEMESAIEILFTENRNRDDLILLYFSGHGIRDDKDGTLYFATRGTKKNDQGRILTSTVIPSSALQRYMGQSCSKRQVLILDCCFSGAFANDMKAKQVEETIDIKAQLGSEGRAVLTSSTATQVSLEKEGASIYTRYLVQGLETGAADQDNDGKISIDELHEYAKDKVQEEAPTMQPEIYTVREGYKIWIARAPQDDPKLIYRKELDEIAKQKRGKLSFVVQQALKIRWQELGLSSQDAALIETEVLQPHRIFEAKLADFEQTVKEILNQPPQIISESLDDLQYLQRVLKLRDEDVLPILSRYSLHPTPHYPSTPNEDESISKSPVNNLENDIGISDLQEIPPQSQDSPKLDASNQVEPLRTDTDSPTEPQYPQQQLSPSSQPVVSRPSIPSTPSAQEIFLKFALVAALLLGGVWLIYAAFIWATGNSSDPTPNPSYSPKPVKNLISAGDNEDLYGSRRRSLDLGYRDQQIKGIQEFRAKNYGAAFSTFETIREARVDQENNNFSIPQKDPEILIFQNNSKARLNQQNQQGSPIYTIAAAVPLSNAEGVPFNIGQQMLFGIAHAQDNAIKKGINLEIVIANDRNLPNQAQELAKELRNQHITGFDNQRREVLAVIGHYSSTVTCAALPFYNEAGLTVISPVSTRTDLRSKCDGDKVFFRTVSSSAVEAGALADYLVNKIDNPKVAVFYKEGEMFSQDLFKAFKEALRDRAQISQFDLSNPLFDLSSPLQVEEVKKQLNEFNVLAVFPDGRTWDNIALKRAINIIKLDGGSRLLLGSNPLYDWEVVKEKSLANKLQVLPDNKGKGLVLAIDWLPGCGSKTLFVEEAKGLWLGPPNRISALSYEAVQVIVDRLKRGKTTRQDILSDLGNSENKVISDVSQEKTISFTENGDRAEIKNRILVTPYSYAGNQFGPVKGVQSCPP